MSRRKQANPKPLQKGEVGTEPVVTKQPKQYLMDSNQSCDDEDDFRPLVIDTSQENSPTEAEDLKIHTQNNDKNDATNTHVNMPTGEVDTPSPSEASIADFDAAIEMDNAEVLGSRRSSISSSDSHGFTGSLLNIDMSPKDGNLQNYSGIHLKRGKGTAPSKTRRKGDRILPVGSDTGTEKFVCPVCKQLLMTAADFTRHIRSHNTTATANANTCTICGKVLSSQSSLDRHMLVHSGERPFECRVCKMSFTTNGNMHRHMRIHQKEQLGSMANSTLSTPQKDPSTLGPVRSRCRNRKFDDSPTEENIKYEETPSPPKQNDATAMFALKRKLEPGNKEVEELPRKRPAPPLGLLTCPRVPLTTPEPSILPAYKRLLQYRPAPDKHSTPVTMEKSVLHCNVCNERFHCAYGLETHMSEAHSDLQNVCPQCFMVFHSTRGLQVHQVMVHQSPATGHEASSRGPALPTSPAPVGFKDLSCIDFSSKKFPEISRAWCEKNQRLPSSYLHDFSCSRCGRAFPSRGALRLHMDSHAPEKTSTCRICDCSFRSQEAYKVHQAVHNSEKVVHSYTKMTGAENNDLQDCVSKPEFMLVMGLARKNKQNPRKKLESTFDTDVRQDMKLNAEYFHKMNNSGMKAEPPFKASGERTLRQEHPVAMKSQALLEQLKAPTLRDMHERPGYKEVTTMATTPDSQSEGNLRTFGRRIQHSVSPSQPLNGAARHCRARSDDDTSAIDEDLSNHSTEAVSSDVVERDDQDEPYICKYCDDSFPSYRSMKTHERCHLGLSPYQCNLCTYSSTDKSTLVRHLRTHNGERPFQCLVCDFAFTTKANCERHVRKRHDKSTKEDIEATIGYNQYISENSIDAEAFTSPDTVCKYCGEDFKFFRALKHHLRSHSSCRYKPFMCKLCSMGFSTKANCMRHIQKQHTEIEQNQVEAHIQVNEITEEEQSEVSPESMALSSTPCGSSVSDWTRDLAFGESPVQSGWKQQPIKPFPMRSAGFSLCKVPAPYITTPPNVYVKPEVPELSDSGFEQPLDFSMKAHRHSQSEDSAGALDMSKTSITAHDDQSASQDMPIDLTVKKNNASVAGGLPSPSPSSKFMQTLSSQQSSTSKNLGPLMNAPQPFQYTPVQRPRSSDDTSSYGNPYTPMKLPVLVQPSSSSSSLIQVPSEPSFNNYKDYQNFNNPVPEPLQCPHCKMSFRHKLKLLNHLRSHTDEQPFACLHCPASFTTRIHLEKHMKTRHVEALSNAAEGPTSSVAAVTLHPAYLKYASQMSAVPASLVRSVGNVAQKETNNNIPKGLEEAGAPRRIESKSSTSSSSDTELASVTRILDATDSLRFQRFFRDRVTSPHANVASNVAMKPYNCSMATPLTTVQSFGFKPTIKREIDDQRSETPESQFSGSLSQLTPASRLTDSQSPIKDEDLDDSDMAQSPGGDPNRKKRNSYADSPHKLQCPYCPRAFPWISSLKRHILTHTGQKPFKCPQCPVTFSTKSNRERHMIRKHGMNVHDPATRQMMDRPYKCHLCVFSSFSTAGNLLKHYKERHPEKEMPGAMAGQGFEDSACFGEFGPDNMSTASDFSSSVMNLMDFDEEDEDGDDYLQDGLCKKLLSQPVDFTLSPGPSTSPPTPSGTPTLTPVPTPVHFLAAAEGTPDRHVNPERDNYNVDKITECWKCGASFESRKSLLRHLKEHNIDCPFKCYLCDASFDTRLDSLEHKISRHTNDWDTIKDKNKIVDHQDFVATQDGLVQEMLAGRLTSRSGLELAEDLKPESDYAQRKVYCSLCIKRFWSLQDLRRHMRSHTGERPFECDVCQARFTLKHSMMRHRRKHLEAEGIGAASDEEGNAAFEDNHDHLVAAVNPSVSSVFVNHPSRPPVHSIPNTVTIKPIRHSSKVGASLQGDLHGDLQGDLLHNLLGVEDAEIDQMLDSADNAAEMLGM